MGSRVPPFATRAADSQQIAPTQGREGASSPAGTQRGPLGIGAEEAELLAAGRLEDEPERRWVRVAAGLRAARLDAADAVLPAAVDDDAPAGGDDVAVPVHVLAVGELGDEPLGHLGQDDRRLIRAAGPAAHVADQRERTVTGSGHPARYPIQGVLQHPEETPAYGVVGQAIRSGSDAAGGGMRTMIDVERVDYIRVPVTDMEQANHFYGEVLGLRRNRNSPGEDWVEYEVGNVT